MNSGMVARLAEVGREESNGVGGPRWLGPPHPPTPHCSSIKIYLVFRANIIHSNKFIEILYFIIKFDIKIFCPFYPSFLHKNLAIGQVCIYLGICPVQRWTLNISCRVPVTCCTRGAIRFRKALNKYQLLKSIG